MSTSIYFIYAGVIINGIFLSSAVVLTAYVISWVIGLFARFKGPKSSAAPAKKISQGMAFLYWGGAILLYVFLVNFIFGYLVFEYCERIQLFKNLDRDWIANLWLGSYSGGFFVGIILVRIIHHFECKA